MMDAITLPAWSLWRRELVRFFRQPNRVIGAIGQPLTFWVLIGSGLSSLRGDYATYFYPGTIVLVVLFTSIFSSMSTIEDRREGFLQSVLVAPIPRTALVLGKVLGGSTLALIQGLALVALAPVAGIRLGLAEAAASFAALVLISFSLTSLGFAVAWKMDSTQGFHAFMGLILFPMWLLSGAFFPAAGTPLWVRFTIATNPLSYGVALLRRAMGETAVGPAPESVPGVGISILFTLIFCATTFGAALILTRRKERGGAHP